MGCRTNDMHLGGGCNLKESLVLLPIAGPVVRSCQPRPLKLGATPGGPFRRYPQRTERCVPTGVIDGLGVRPGSSGGASHKMGDLGGIQSSLKISGDKVVS